LAVVGVALDGGTYVVGVIESGSSGPGRNDANAVSQLARGESAQ
jgi:hypothetical protein